MLDNTVKRVPDRTALAVKRDGEWVKWTYTEYQVMMGSGSTGPTQNTIKRWGVGQVDLHRIPFKDGEWVKWTNTEYQIVMGSGLSRPTQNIR